MYSEAETQEYLDEIREQVCSKCVERLPGGPPRAPLGKKCGIELHLPMFLDAVHEVDSPVIEPYLDNIHRRVCSQCSLRGCDGCPCPMDYLLVLLVQSIETVDRRRLERGFPSGTSGRRLTICRSAILDGMCQMTPVSAEPSQHGPRAGSFCNSVDHFICQRNPLARPPIAANSGINGAGRESCSVW